MGWDAYSSAPRAFSELKEKQHRLAFEFASKRVKDNAGSVDGSLPRGGLGLKSSAKMLETAYERTGEIALGFFFHPYQDDEVTPEQVKVLAKMLDWDFDVPAEDRSSYLSAKEFINVCADLGLGIRFSY